MNWLTLGLEIAAGWWLCGFVATGFFIAYDKADDPDSWHTRSAGKLRITLLALIPMLGLWAAFEVVRHQLYGYGWTISAKPVSTKTVNIRSLNGLRVTALPSGETEIVIAINRKPVTIYSGPWPATREALLSSYTSIIADGLEAE